MEFPFVVGLQSGIVFRLLPSFILVIWFAANFLNKRRYQLAKNTGKNLILTLSFLKTIANITIVTGAVMKLYHISYSQFLLIGGIGFLATWSSILVKVSVEKSGYNPDIIDDEDDDLKLE